MDKQIAKFKSRRGRARLARYSAIVSLLLLFSTLASGISPTSLTTFALVLPVPVYFCLQSLKLYRKNKIQMEPLTSGLISGLPTKFSFGKFLTQPSFAFRLSLILFFLIFFTTLARSRPPSPTLSTHYLLPATN